MTYPGPNDPSENNNAFPTRRELRTQRAGSSRATVSVPVHAAIPVVAADIAVSGAPTRAVAISAVVPAAAAAKPATRRPRRKNPFTVVVTLIAIPGLFLTAGLPAYAFSPGQGQGVAGRQRATTGAQGVNVAAGAVNVTVARDGFTATSTEELAMRDRAAKRAASSKASAAEFAVYGVRAPGDDYPWPYEITNLQGGGLSPLGYYYRECVDFVAWRLNRDAGSTGGNWRWTWSNLTPGGGNASSWASAWASAGRTTSHTPIVGAVAWFTYNHVAYVQKVNPDGTVLLEEYNWMGNHMYHTRTVQPSEVNLYLYPPA